MSNLVRVCEASHPGHDTQDIVAAGVNADLGGLVGADSSCGNHEPKGGVVDSGEIAGAGWLVLLRLECEGVDIDTGIGASSVVLVGLHKIKVGTLTFRKAVLAVELKLARDNWVFTPAVEIKRSLSKHKCTNLFN